MDKKITIPAGIALMVVLAVAGMLAIFSYTAATPVEAAVVAGSVTYDGPTGSGATGDVTVAFDTNATIAANTNIVINFPIAFGMPETLTGVTVDGTAATAVAATVGTPATATNVTVPVATAITYTNTDVSVSIVIPGVTAPAAAADYDVTVTPASVTGVAVSVTIADAPLTGIAYDGPDKPGKADSLEIEFTAGSAGVGSGGSITISLHEDFTVPGTISPSDVEIDVEFPGFASLPVSPRKVTVDDDDIWEDEDDTIELDLGDMSPEVDDSIVGIPAFAMVTVTIAKAAGIVGPTEAGRYNVAVQASGYADMLEYTEAKTNDDDQYLDEDDDVVATEAEAEQIPALNFKRLVTLNEEDGGRGDTIVATAKGITDDGTADFWRDANADGIVDNLEEILCDDVAVSDNVAECTFDLTEDFAANHGDCPNNADDFVTELASGFSNCNVINVRDGAFDTAAIHGEDDVIELEKSLSLSPAEGNPGDKITIQMRDFPVRTNVASVTIAGADRPACLRIAVLAKPATETTLAVLAVAACGASGATNSRGDADFVITIPTVPPGSKKLIVKLDDVGETDDDAIIVIGGASLLASPAEVLPNQSIRLTGSGFTGGADINTISLGGDNIDVPDDTTADSGGSWSASVIIPITPGTAAGGDRVLRVTDAVGRSGTTTLSFPERTVSIAPEEGRVGSTVTITGSNYPVSNSDDDAADDNDIALKVQYGDDKAEDVEADAAGNWQVSLKVPNKVDIPSTNVVKIQFDTTSSTGAVTTVIDTFKHRVPRAGISLSPTTGVEGSMVTATATGFNRFVSMDLLEVGDTEVTVSPNPSTDRNGDTTFSFQIPGADPGVYNVTVDFDGTTASMGYTVVDASGVVGAVTSGVETALAPLVDGGTLDRVFYFNNATKEWQWYISDPDFASTNNLNEVVSGAPLWVLVTEDTSVVLNTRLVDFTCAGDDCWNLITFP